ncbi:MAG TPA: hypothetical protein DCG75_19295 [Bacteroidales bacterium]|nr:hypothetical protein [Bacteroidales bacterium]
MSYLSNKNKRALILVMIALSFIVISISYFYYKNINSSKDPRVKPARELYEKYNNYAIQNDFVNIFALLDSVEYIYNNVSHYEESFEVGVLYNNRAAAYLTMYLYEDRLYQFKDLSRDKLLQLAEIAVDKSISIYKNWLNIYSDKNLNQVSDLMKNDFLQGLDQYTEKEKERFLTNRIKEIETAQYETERRLSVAYTNLGIIYRHREEYEQTINCYEKAIELWDQNLTAENNFNILLGKPLKKRNLIQKLFPPKQKEN